MIVEIKDRVGEGIVQECWLYPGSHANRNMGLYDVGYTLSGATIFTVLKAVLPDFGNIEVIDSKFILWVYQVTGPANIYWNRIKKVWNEGTGTTSGHTTLDGEVTYNSARHNEELWDTPGAQNESATEGVGDITPQIGSASTGVDASFDVSIPVADTQGWHDGDFMNQGILMRSLDNNIYWYSSENVNTVYRVKFYMEYIEVVGWSSNSHYGNRSIASINSPQRSRRTY